MNFLTVESLIFPLHFRTLWLILSATNLRHRNCYCRNISMVQFICAFSCCFLGPWSVYSFRVLSTPHEIHEYIGEIFGNDLNLHL